jgi:hypothetical protein
MSVRLYNTLYFNYLVPPLLTASANRKCNGRDTFYNKFTDPRYLCDPRYLWSHSYDCKSKLPVTVVILNFCKGTNQPNN